MNRSHHHAQPAGVTARQPGARAAFIHGALRWLRAGVWRLAWLTCLLGANAGAQTDPAVAEMLVKQSGLWEQLAAFPETAQKQVLLSFQSDKSLPTPAELERLQQAAGKAFVVERLRSCAVQVVGKRLLPEHLNAIQAWFSSPVGERLVQAESLGSGESADFQAEALKGLALLEAATPVRKALIIDLLKAIHAVEGTVQMITGLNLAIRRGVVAASPGHPLQTERELRAVLEDARPKLEQLLTIMLTGSFASGYRGVADEDLSQYLAFLNSEPGKHFSALGLLALGAAMNDAFEDFGRQLLSVKDSANP